MKLMVWLVIVVMLTSVALAPQEGRGSELNRNTGVQERESVARMQQMGNEVPPLRNQERVRELQQVWQQERKQMMAQLNQTPLQERQRLMVHEEARIAARAMNRLSNGSDGCSEEFCRLAQEFEASLQLARRMEERINAHSGVYRFFMGGDRSTAESLESVRLRNQERLQQMSIMANVCNCTEQAREQLREQIRLMEREHNRTQPIVEQEMSRRGLFRWFGGE